MTMASNLSGETPTVGARVVTADGDELGKVKEVSGTCFKVDASMQPDYWLAADSVASQTGGEVRLVLKKDRLGDAKVDAPDHSGVHRHS